MAKMTKSQTSMAASLATKIFDARTLLAGSDQARQDALKSALELVQVLSMGSLSLSANVGECQKVTPFSSLRPVIKPNGKLYYCCEHGPEHCVEVGK
jgi:hypothetical protein